MHKGTEASTSFQFGFLGVNYRRHKLSVCRAKTAATWRRIADDIVGKPAAGDETLSSGDSRSWS